MKQKYMKYRKKPVEVEAMKWAGYFQQDIEDFIGSSFKRTEPRDGIGVVGYFVRSRGVDMWLHSGDWIVKDVNGEFYVCNNHIFEMTHEKIIE